MINNKKGEGEVLFFIFFILLIGGFFSALASNEYTSFIKDCEGNKLNQELFEYNYNDTCYKEAFNNETAYACVKTSYKKEELNLYCQNKYVSFEEKRNISQ